MAELATVTNNSKNDNNLQNGQTRIDEETREEGEQNATAPVQRQQPTQGNGYFELFKSMMIRFMFLYFITSFFRKPAAPSTEISSTPKLPSFNLFENGTVMDLFVYLSLNEVFDDFNNPDALLWEKHGIIYGRWDGGDNGDAAYKSMAKFEVPSSVKNNGSLYLHTYIIKRIKHDNTKVKTWIGPNVISSTKQLVRFKKLRFTKTHNLLTGESLLSPEEIEIAEKNNKVILGHWHQNLTINILTDQTNWVQGTVPAPLNEYLQFSPNGSYYKPFIYYNDFWNLLRDYQPINETTEFLELHMTFQPLSLFKWQMYAAHAIRSQFSVFQFQDEADDDDQDTLKETLLETSPYLVAATIAVSILHSVFELLAFKNDIQFWNNRKSLEGLSVRLVFFNVFQSLVVLLYVLDNDTNTIIRISCFVTVAIEIWKINKVCDISLNRQNKILGIFPTPVFTDKGSYVESSTKEYDQLAFKYLSWVLFPLLVGYAIYSLFYQEHKGWYSWVLNMIYGFLLTFGFITMTPQLFINYKLKSVAHLPWRMMTYKCLNTFIDDVFAFVIKMPTMYRLGCFRDDVVFFIFLYQRWIYKTDPKRRNEFGYSGEELTQSNSQNTKTDNDKKTD